jgi:hypothetical protein
LRSSRRRMFPARNGQGLPIVRGSCEGLSCGRELLGE